MKLKLICAAFVLLAFMGCAKPPLAEMDSAREAVLRAENDADAVLYASSTLARARDALKLMEAEADSKRYDSAKIHAAEAIAAAEKAIADGKTGAERVRGEAASLLSGLKPAIEETGKNIDAGRSAELDLDFSGLDQELNGARRRMEEAESYLAENRYQDALEKCRGVRATLGDINLKLSNAATAVSRKK